MGRQLSFPKTSSGERMASEWAGLASGEDVSNRVFGRDKARTNGASSVSIFHAAGYVDTRVGSSNGLKRGAVLAGGLEPT